jgi:hypothetical protein
MIIISVKHHKTERKRGPIPGPPTVKATVLVEPELVEWGKQQPGGLSELVRRLLRGAYEADLERRESVREARQTALASEDALAKIWNTPEEDAAWQHL